MIIIPQIYLRDGKVVIPEGRASPIFHEDPVETARAMKDAGAESIYIIDLDIQPVVSGTHLAVIKKIRSELKLSLFVGGYFKAMRSIGDFIDAGVGIVVLGVVAYQQPAFLEEASKSFPGRIATHIDVKGGHVTIPGYAVVTNKTALDYAERFREVGIRHILYSDVGVDGLMSQEHFDNIKAFCEKTVARVICTSEVSNLSEIERMVKLNMQRLEGLILAKSLYEGRIDLRGAIAMVSDLMLAQGSEVTVTEM